MNRPFPSCLLSLIQNEFDLHLNGLLSKTHFHIKGFAPELVLKQSQRELGNDLLYHDSYKLIRSGFLSINAKIWLFVRLGGL